MMMMMMSTFMAHNSINVNAQCSEGLGGRGGGSSELVTCRFTPSQPLRLYQGDGKKRESRNN